MRDVWNEYVEFKSECNFSEIGHELWSGAKDRWGEADYETRVAVWDRVKEWADCVSCDGHLPSITQINDIIWFECDDLFYPTKFMVKVYRADENGDRDYRFEPLYEETFEGLSAEQDARDWWDENSEQPEESPKWTGEVVAFLWNCDDGSEEEL